MTTGTMQFVLLSILLTWELLGIYTTVLSNYPPPADSFRLTVEVIACAMITYVKKNVNITDLLFGG